MVLTDTQENLWWIAVIAGFVVVLAVAALLTILVLLVRTIDRRVAAIKATLVQAKNNTADAVLLGQTAAGSTWCYPKASNITCFLAGF